MCKETNLKSKNGELEIKNLGLVLGQIKLIRGGLKPHARSSSFQLLSRKRARDNAPASNSLAKYTFIHSMKPNTRPSGTTIIKFTGTLKQYFLLKGYNSCLFVQLLLGLHNLVPIKPQYAYYGRKCRPSSCFALSGVLLEPVHHGKWGRRV